MNKPLFEVADIARVHGRELTERGKLTAHQKKVMTAICNCRTAELGGHKERCNDPGCSYERLSLIHISEPTRLGMISYAVFCLKKKKNKKKKKYLIPAIIQIKNIKQHNHHKY